MKYQFINRDLITSFSVQKFMSQPLFPWSNFHQFLTPAVFEKLCQEFPSLDQFEQHNGIQRAYEQRPHNRYYLAYETSIYAHFQDKGNGNGNGKSKGTIRHSGLSTVWQAFLEELQTSREYRNFIHQLLGLSKFSKYRVRYAWHIGFMNSEVSPHCDSKKKVGTHIFYFNTSDDWNSDWGGSTLVLGGKKVTKMNPDFTDFEIALPTQMIDNHSLLFKNTDNAWHGVKALNCPKNSYRKLFNVIFEYL